eukprot:TRINITY_DN4955_c0_g4_i1.p1 TRINITY_DN4955_c0_g4~~TRINITY_DN4955_c0_g4_i1.p1  ORF type:complete len:514 (-),score=38.34 TRINITY_DN4955_c0_g4_i1:66-1607(-)
MEQQVTEPLLTNAEPTPFTSIAAHRQAWGVGILEDDQEFLRSGWSRRPYLGYLLAIYFAIAAFSDVSYGLKFAVMDVIAVVMNAVVVPFFDKASTWVDLFVCAQSIYLSAALSYSLPAEYLYYSTMAQATYSLMFIFFGLRTRYLALAIALVFVLFDRSTGGMLMLATSLVCLFICSSVIQSFFYTAFSLQRSQDALVQYASDGFCSVSVNQGRFVSACSRFQDAFKNHDLCGHRLQDFIDATDESRIEDMLRSAKHGRLDQCLVTFYVPDAAIAFDAALIPHQYNGRLDTVDVCLKLQGEVRPCDKNSANDSGVEPLPSGGRNQHAFVDIDGTSYHEMQVNSSAQQSDDSIYDVMWDIIDAAASSDIVRSFSARSVVIEAQQMQALLFAQKTRARQRAVARSLLRRCESIRVDVLRENVAIPGLRQIVLQERHCMETRGNFEADRLSSRERILEDVVSAHRVFHHTELFGCNPCLRGLHITCEMLGFFGPLPSHRKLLRPKMMNLVRTFEHG